MKNDIYNWIIRALRNVEKCYFEAKNERTFHSEFYHQLRLLQDQTDPKYKLMCEVEKVKRTLGNRRRPDIIFHIPKTLEHDEFAIELKRNAYFKKIEGDLESLRLLKEQLEYKQGVLINLGHFSNQFIKSLNSHHESWMNDYLVFIEVCWENNDMKINSFQFRNDILKVRARKFIKSQVS